MLQCGGFVTGRTENIDKLLLATTNRGKLREYRALLDEVPFRLTSLDDESIYEEVEEEGGSFEENAALKAKRYASLSGLLTLADDSGLEVDALNGEPGVQSARYAGEGASDEDRIHVLLAKMEGVPVEERQARFRCVIALAWPSGRVELMEGVRGGIIALEPKGNNGFGYDPVFYLHEYGKTMAEIATEEKNRISHRADAARKAAAFLRKLTEGKRL